MDLGINNAWWRGKAYMQEDKHIKDLENKKFKWKPELLRTIVLEPNNLFTLRGPRQVGKTTLIKLLIRELLNKGVSERSIFYWNCDELVDFRELSSILREYISLSDKGERYIFLDEVSRVKDWQRSIKSLIDSGELEDCCLMVTGSNTLDIKYGSERLPGRTGKKGKDFVLLPMNFSSFVKLVNPDIGKNINKITLTIDNLNKEANKLKIFETELKSLFDKYLITGGFPLVVNEFLTNKKIPDYLYELYFKWIVGDIVKWGKREKILVQLFKSLLEKQSSRISWDSLAKESEIKSHKTVSAYVEDLENMFVLIVLYFVDLKKKIANPAKNKKIYIFDPFIYHVFNKKIYFKDNEVSNEILEATIIANLARFDYGGLFPSIFYWNNKKEVDAVLRLKDKLLPFEIKYQNNIKKEDYKGLHYFDSGVLITKNLLKKGEKYTTIPAYLLLAMDISV